jgi:hypothetical protein
MSFGQDSEASGGGNGCDEICCVWFAADVNLWWPVMEANMSAHTGKYVPPHRIGGSSPSSGTLLALSSTKATALRDWLNT